MFGFGRKPREQLIFEQARAGNLSALQHSTSSLPDAAPATVPTVRELEYIDRDGRTALCVAAQKGHVAVARLLISKGANINACTNKRDGGTPLHEATSAASSPDMINLLMNAGASPFVANTRGSTCYDIAIDRKIPTLVRRFETAAKLGAFVHLKVPGLLGFGGEFREFWVVLFQRIPNPAVPPQNRVSHSQLFLFPNYTEAMPLARLWTDGAQVAMLQNPLRNGASAVLMLHHQHQKPMHVYVDYDSARRPCLFMKASMKANHASAVDTLASCVNDTTSAAAAVHRAATGGPLPGVPPPGTIPQYSPSATSTSASHVESAAGSAWALATAAASSVSAMAGSVLHSNSSSSPGQQSPRPGGPLAPSAPPAPTVYVVPGQAPGGYQAGYVPAQYHPPGFAGQPAAHATPGVPPQQPPAVAQGPGAPQVTSSDASAATSAPQVPDTLDELAPEGEEPCIVCLENKKAIGFLHKGTMHLCACRSCAHKWHQQHRTCPMCNVEADTLVPVYS